LHLGYNTKEALELNINYMFVPHYCRKGHSTLLSRTCYGAMQDHMEAMTYIKKHRKLVWINLSLTLEKYKPKILQ